MRTMGFQYVFSSFNPVKNRDDGINTINGKEKHVPYLPRFDDCLKQKITQKHGHADTSHIPCKSFGLLADIKKSEDQARQSHGNQQGQTRCVNGQNRKTGKGYQGIQYRDTIDAVHKIEGIDPAYQQNQYQRQYPKSFLKEMQLIGNQQNRKDMRTKTRQLRQRFYVVNKTHEGYQNDRQGYCPTHVPQQKSY